MRLELGAGEHPFLEGDDWVHNDQRLLDHIETVGDANDPAYCHLLVARHGLFDGIRATHLLEHFSYLVTVNILCLWYSMLRPGGELYIEVPNLEWQMRAYVDGEIDARKAVYYIFGGQDYEGNFHRAGFDLPLLTQVLREAGFEKIVVTSIGQVLCASAVKPEQAQV